MKPRIRGSEFGNIQENALLEELGHFQLQVTENPVELTGRGALTFGNSGSVADFSQSPSWVQGHTKDLFSIILEGDFCPCPSTLLKKEASS